MAAKRVAIPDGAYCEEYPVPDVDRTVACMYLSSGECKRHRADLALGYSLQYGFMSLLYKKASGCVARVAEKATKKRCNSCGDKKAFAEFHKERRAVGGLQGTCRDCARAYHAERKRRLRVANHFPDATKMV